jgi:hypothetical protein
MKHNNKAKTMKHNDIITANEASDLISKFGIANPGYYSNDFGDRFNIESFPAGCTLRVVFHYFDRICLEYTGARFDPLVIKLSSLEGRYIQDHGWVAYDTRSNMALIDGESVPLPAFAAKSIYGRVFRTHDIVNAAEASEMISIYGIKRDYLDSSSFDGVGTLYSVGHGAYYEVFAEDDGMLQLYLIDNSAESTIVLFDPNNVCDDLDGYAIRHAPLRRLD